MNIFNDTVIDKKTYTDFQIFHGRISKRFFFLNVIYYIVCLALVAYAYYKGIAAGSTPIILLGVTLTIIWLGLVYSRYVQPRLNFKKNVKEPQSIRYHFFTNSFKIVKEGMDEEKIDSLLYKKIIKVYETKSIFYLYYSKTVVYLVRRDGFAAPAECKVFKEQLQSVLGKRFIKTM